MSGLPGDMGAASGWVSVRTGMLADLCLALIGSLPIVYDAGGSRDALSHLDAAAGRGNGFVFCDFNVDGLLWAVGRAIEFL